MHLVRDKCIVLILVYMIFCKDTQGQREKTTGEDFPIEESETTVI